METQDFLKYQHLYRDEIRIRERQSLMLRFSKKFQARSYHSNTHMKIFDALDNGCDVYRVCEQLMDRQLEMEDLIHELIAWCDPVTMARINETVKVKREKRDEIIYKDML